MESKRQAAFPSNPLPFSSNPSSFLVYLYLLALLYYIAQGHRFHQKQGRGRQRGGIGLRCPDDSRRWLFFFETILVLSIEKEEEIGRRVWGPRLLLRILRPPAVRALGTARAGAQRRRRRATAARTGAAATGRGRTRGGGGGAGGVPAMASSAGARRDCGLCGPTAHGAERRRRR